MIRPLAALQRPDLHVHRLFRTHAIGFGRRPLKLRAQGVRPPERDRLPTGEAPGLPA